MSSINADLKTLPDLSHPFLSKKSALIVVDFQNGLLALCDPNKTKSFIQANSTVIDFARRHSVEVIYTRLFTDPESCGPVWHHNILESTRPTNLLVKSRESALFDSIRPGTSEHVIDRTGIYDPFSHHEFEKYIADAGYEHLIITGLHSDVAVDATARSAFQKGIFVTIVADAILPQYAQDSTLVTSYMSQAYGAKVVTSDQICIESIATTQGSDLGKPKDSSIWFRSEIGPRLAKSTQHVYKKWSGLEGKQLETHIREIRQKAWRFFEYPCVGQWMFLLPSIGRLPWFSSVLERLERGPNVSGLILDLGTFLGQDLRLLATHDIPTSRMRGLDRDERPWNLGYDLFLDYNKFEGQFIHGDFFADAQAEAKMYGLPWQDHVTTMAPFSLRNCAQVGYPTLDKKQDIISSSKVLGSLRNQHWSLIIAAQFIHLYSLPQQTVACIRIAEISRPGTMLIGYQGGRKNASTSERPWGTMFHHNIQTWRNMWEVVQIVTGTKWEVYVKETSFHNWGMPKEDYAWMADDEMGLDFFCERIG